MKRIRAVSLSAMVVSHLLFTAVHAQPLSNIPHQDFWVTDGSVWATQCGDATTSARAEYKEENV